MKNYFLLLLSMLFVLFANGQTRADIAHQRINLEKPVLERSNNRISLQIPDKKLKSEQHYKNLRTIGIITTGTGIASEIIGINMVYNHMALFGGETNATTKWGVGGMFGGALATAGGITMWVMGHRRLKKVRNLNLQQSGNGISLVYKL